MTVKADRDNGGEWVDRYRQASVVLDEHPSASVRASILAAAAREAKARPMSADAPRSVRPRWPLAAAAAVMLSTLALMLAIRTNEEMPQFNAPPETRSGAADVTKPVASAPAPSMVEPSSSKRETNEQQAPDVRSAPQQERSGVRASNEAPAAQVPRESSPSAKTPERSDVRARRETDSSAEAPRQIDRPGPTESPATARLSELEKSRPNVPPAAPAPPPAPEPIDRPKLRAEQSAAGAAAQTPPVDQASSDARRDAAKPAAVAPSAAQIERKQADESVAAWLERIIKLRREGRHDEAELELKRFRERYPQAQPPSEALAPSGAR